MHLPDLSLPITEPVLIFGLVMLMTLVLPLLFQRLRVPGIVGLILAGVLVGPYGLGILARDATMQLLGTVGLLYIMFIAGLEVDLNEFNRQRHRSAVFGFLTFILPQGLGALMAHFLLGFDWTAAILLGAVFASHTLLAYPIVSRLGLSKGEAVTTAVGATILTDTAALIVLAVVVRSAEGGLTTLFWMQMTILLTIYVIGILWGVPRLGRWFFQKIRTDGVFDFVFVLAVVFISAFIASLVGVEPIIGAFLAGLALNRLVPEHSTLMNRTRFVGDSLFIPFFLLSVGMLVDVAVLTAGTRAWIIAGSMLGTVIVAKWLAAQLTRPLFAYSSDQGWMLFGLTIPQAAATLATVLIGYNVGIFGDGVLNGTILMMLVTCMLGPWFAEHYGRKVALRAERTPIELSRVPQRILVPLANPEKAPLLMDMAFMIWDPKSEQPIYPLAIVRNQNNVQAGVASGEKLLGHAVVHAAGADVPVLPLVRIDPNVAHGIMRAVKERMISTIVIGWNGKSSGRHYAFGSILDQLLEESHELLLVSKIEQPLATVERVLLALPPNVEFDPSFPTVVRTVKTLANQVGASILVLATRESILTGQAAIESTKPDVPTNFHVLEDWSAFLSECGRVQNPHDLLYLVDARHGTLAWRPTLSRLPRQLARRFPSSNLVICYPAVPFEESISAHTLPSGDLVLGGLISANRINLEVKGETSEEILRSLLNPTASDEPNLIRGATDAFSLMEADYVPELMPGVVLYHAHVSGIEDPLLFVGISNRGLRIRGSTSPVHVVLALLSPESGAAEDHLRSLAMVARLVRSGETIDRLRNVSSAHEVRNILAESLLAPTFGWHDRPPKHPTPSRTERPGGTPLYGHVGVVIQPHSDLDTLLSDALSSTMSFGRRMNLLIVGTRSSQREARVREALHNAGLSRETPIAWTEQETPHAVLRTASRIGAELLIVEAYDDSAALGTGLGSAATGLIQSAPQSLLLLTPVLGRARSYRRIVLVAEYGDQAVNVLRRVLRLAESERAETLYIVRIRQRVGSARILAGSVESDTADSRPAIALEQEILEDYVHAGGETATPIQTFYLEGQADSAAAQFAHRYKADLLILPSHRWYTNAADRLFPSETSWSLREAPCDVWVVREGNSQ